MSLKIVFMGTPEFSIPALSLIKKSSHKIICVYSQPPKKSYRGQKVHLTPVHEFAKKENLLIRTPNEIDSHEEYKILNDLKPDIVIVVAYGKKIPKKFLSIPKYGFINLHASLLPKLRGAAPIQRSILNLDKFTGVSIMKIEEEIDSGPVINKLSVKIDATINAETLSKKLSIMGSKLLISSVDEIVQGKANFKEQDHSIATFAKKITKEESKIDWNENAINIIAKINGLYPFPGAWFLFRGARHKVLKASLVDISGEAGKVLDKNLIIGCKKKSIKILEIQREGKKKQNAKDFIIGSKIKKGEFLI